MKKLTDVLIILAVIAVVWISIYLKFFHCWSMKVSEMPWYCLMILK